MIYRLRLRWRLLFADRHEARLLNRALRDETRRFCRR